MKYVDGFVLAVAKRKMKAYIRMAQQAGKIWREYGALDYKECAIDDSAATFGVPFPQMMNAKRGETIVFSYIVYKSRTHRDRVNAKVMKDPRIAALCDEKSMPFDMNRMVYGGFEVLVDA
jgi:uncharacterized protein YbaA (DUF1428 family)